MASIPPQVIRDDSLRWVNFFNGRLLTGDDLTQEQTSSREARLRLGEALGDGVVWGLWASADPDDKEIVVSAGEAINRNGQILCLSESQSISLSSSSKGQGTSNVGWFNACGQSQPTGDSLASGLYLLTLGAAEESLEGLAPVSGLGSAAAACNSKYRTEPVQFKILSLPPIQGISSDSDQLRNIVAYTYMGLEDLPTSVYDEDPFTNHPEEYGYLDGQRPSPLTGDDVPLAIFALGTSGILFLDNWSVRRRARLNAQFPASPWHWFISDRRTSEQEAVFLQFQEHLAGLDVANTSFSTGELFRFLPPVGLLPTGTDGVDWRSFLGPHAPANEIQVDAGLLNKILLAALPGQPILYNTAPYTAVDVYRTVYPYDGSTAVSNDKFVLFCRSDLGRLQIEISEEVNPADLPSTAKSMKASSTGGKKSGSSCTGSSMTSRRKNGDPNVQAAGSLEHSESFIIHSVESNLKVYTRRVMKGKYLSPNLAPGSYRITDNTGHPVSSRRAIRIIGGQITKLQVESLRQEDIYLDIEHLEVQDVAEWTADGVRLSLVPGTFAHAIEQMDEKPDTGQRLADISDQLNKAQKARLISWRELLKKRFPLREIATTEPGLIANQAHQAPASTNVEYLPERPQFYATFGNIHIPLTSIEDVESGTPLSPLRSIEPFRTAPDLMSILDHYGIYYLDQLAGAWVNLIVELTGWESDVARELIATALKALQK